MREKLDKLPGADWLCEECQNKKTGNHGVDKSNTIYRGSKPIFLNKTSQNSISTLIPKKLPKLNAGVICLNDEVLATPNISARRQADHVEERKVSEASTTPIKTEGSKKTSVLSYAISFKNQKRKVRKENMELSEGHSVNALPAVHYSENYLSPGSLCQPRTHSSYRHFSRSVSFSNSIINQKVKLAKQRIRREAISSQLRNGTLVKPIIKSASFKNSSSGFSNIDPVSKDQSFHLSRIENPRGLDALKKRIIVEKKNPSAIYKASISKLAASASNCYPKINRSSQNEGNVKSTIDSSCQSVNKRSYDTSDLGCNDSNRRILHSSSSAEFFDEKFSSENGKQCKKVTRTSFSAVNGSCVKVGTASGHGLLQLSESDPKDNKISTGQANQQCATYKLKGSTHLPSDDLNLSKTMKKGTVPENVLDAMVPKTRTLSKCKNLNKFDKLPEANGEVICLADSINTSSSFSQRNIALVVDSSNDNDSLKFSVELGKAVTATDSVNRAVPSTDSLVVPKENRSNHIPTFNEFNVKSLSETSPREESILASQLRASAIPKLGFIWQGSFSVLRSDSCPQLFNGIQAHLSTCASKRVFEIASVVPSKLQVEEVSQTSLWPLQCQGIYPTEKNIALFFFAKDNESYENSYRSLLDKMLENDLAFRGKVNEAELLIFTSKMLPAYSKRWNMLYYLWGMFIGKRKHCLSTQKNCESNLSIEILGQGISELPLRNGPNAQTLDSTLTSMIFSEYDTSPKVNQGEPNICVDLHCMSSKGEPKSCRTKNTSSSVNLSSQVATDAKRIQENPLSLTDNSSSTTAKSLDVISNPELQLQRSRLSYKVNIGMGCQDNFHDDDTNGKLGKSPLAFDINMEVGLDRASPVPSISLNSYSVEKCSKNECKKKTKHCSSNDLAILGYNPRGNTSEINWGGRKHEHSCSTQTVLQTSGKRASWMQVNDESEQKMTCSIENSFGEENLSSIFWQQQRTQNICSESVMPENSRIVERSFFTVDINPPSYNKYDKLAHIAASNDDDDDPESYTPDLELTLGSRSNRKTKPAPLLPLLYPSLDRGCQHRRSGPPGNDGDDLSALLSL